MSKSNISVNTKSNANMNKDKYTFVLRYESEWQTKISPSLEEKIFETLNSTLPINLSSVLLRFVKNRFINKYDDNDIPDAYKNKISEYFLKLIKNTHGILQNVINMFRNKKPFDHSLGKAKYENENNNSKKDSTESYIKDILYSISPFIFFRLWGIFGAIGFILISMTAAKIVMENKNIIIQINKNNLEEVIQKVIEVIGGKIVKHDMKDNEIIIEFTEDIRNSEKSANIKLSEKIHERIKKMLLYLPPNIIIESITKNNDIIYPSSKNNNLHYKDAKIVEYADIYMEKKNIKNMGWTGMVKKIPGYDYMKHRVKMPSYIRSPDMSLMRRDEYHFHINKNVKNANNANNTNTTLLSKLKKLGTVKADKNNIIITISVTRNMLENVEKLINILPKTYEIQKVTTSRLEKDKIDNTCNEVVIFPYDKKCSLWDNRRGYAEDIHIYKMVNNREDRHLW